MNNVKILDCTLRDGGYYNNWDFSFPLVSAYLHAVADAGIDYVELGFRNFPDEKKYQGPFAYTTEALLNSIELPPGPIYGVMVDAKTLIMAPYSPNETIDKLFVSAHDSKIKLVRIASHFKEVAKAEPHVRYLKSLGYIVGFNLMQSGGKSEELIKETVGLIHEWGIVDVLYFADSLGNMDNHEVLRITNAMKSVWPGELGIHTHNNMNRAIDNTLSAIDAGISWVDSTITGMGRGAGNAQTENLLTILTKESKQFNPAPVYDLVIRHFEALQQHYGWGSNLMYFIGAQHDVHPTYIQNLISDERFGVDERIGAINYLCKTNASSYDGSVLESVLRLTSTDVPVSGSDSLNNLFSDREVLIIGGGETIQHHSHGINNFILSNQPITISINVNKYIDPSLVDYFCISHNSKFLADKDAYAALTKPLILPLHRFSKDDLSALNQQSQKLDFGIDLTPGVFDIKEHYCQIPSELTAAYAIACAIKGNAKSILLVGFDGYEKGDFRQNEMVDFFIALEKNGQNKNITSLTPTTYPIREGSIYAPKI